MEIIRVLFLCTGNSARSQMAEAYLRSQAGDRFEVFSAGLEPKGIHPLTLQVLAEIGVDTTSLYSKPLSTFVDRQSFDFLITLCADAEERCPYFPGTGVRLHWPFDDPAAFQGSPSQRLAKFREVRGQIEARIREWLSEFPPRAT